MAKGKELISHIASACGGEEVQYEKTLLPFSFVYDIVAISG